MPERHLTIRLTSEEKALVTRALRRRGCSLQAWAKAVLLDAAGEESTDPAARSRIQRLTLAHAHVAASALMHVLEARGEGDLKAAFWSEAREYLNDLAPRSPLIQTSEDEA
jgi:hypothetical protein